MTTPQRAQPTPWSETPQPGRPLPAHLFPARPIPALTHAFALLGKPWTGLIIAALAQGPADSAQLCESVPGISDRTLADRLQELATAGLLTPTVQPGPPSRTYYSLTPHGNALLIPLAALTVWARDHLPATGTPDHVPIFKE
ncbi:helix-turn-helix domain-containing protein [Streptomyces sp. NPDC050704]|uniref:winged helix-turn-helix transcriptional regulator n=1 Tax=Streptomyces sp. NPDC050704 TaxID=3157219 RepID=UPI00344729BA